MKKQEWINRFLAHLDARPDIGAQRRRKYAGELVYIAELCPCDFEKARKKDIEVLIAKVRTARKHKRVPDKTAPNGYHIKLGNTISDSTKASYFTTVKVFWRWLRNAEALDQGKEEPYNINVPGDYPPEVRWITKRGLRIGSAIQSKDEFLTDEEFTRLLQHAAPKYRALWSILREKGPRISEVLTCKVKDFKQVDENTGLLKLAAHIRGKTKHAQRTVGLCDSMPFLLRWLNDHPERDNPEAWLFPNHTACNKVNDRLTSASSVVSLKRTAKRAGITKRVWNHMFRHESITRARGELRLGDGIVKQEHGLSPSSTVLANYSKLTDDDANQAYFEAKGVRKPGRKFVDNTKPKQCPWCHELNPFVNQYCDACTRPLDPTKIEERVQLDTMARAAGAWMVKNHPEVFKEFVEHVKSVT